MTAHEDIVSTKDEIDCVELMKDDEDEDRVCLESLPGRL